MPLSQDDQAKYKSLYLQTARQYVTELKDSLNQLGTGNGTDEVIESLHRAAHSLGGQSAMMSYNSMYTISSVIEKIFKAKKEKKIDITDTLLADLVTAVNEMEKCLDSIDKDNKEIDFSKIVELLKSTANSPEV
jgi:two-component system chemotaxis sensor kinase CheA